MAGKNIAQLTTTTTVQDTDLYYLGRSPYNNTDDRAITWADIHGALALLFQALNVNLTGLSNLSSVLSGPVSQVGLIGGVQAYHTPIGKTAYTGTSFNNLALGVSYEDEIELTNSGAITGVLDATGKGVGYGFYINLTSTGTITFDGGLVPVFGVTSVTGGGTNATSPRIRVSLTIASGNVAWEIEVTNSLGIIAGSNISVSRSGSGTTISTTGASSLTYTTVTGTSQAMAVNQGYIANNAALVTFTLPTTIAVGEMVAVAGRGAGGWKIAQNSGQVINLGNLPTTLGVGGSLASTNQFDNIKLMCIVANTTFIAFPPQGNITVV